MSSHRGSPQSRGSSAARGSYISTGPVVPPGCPASAVDAANEVGGVSILGTMP
ncbi:MAG: hypothetical protein ACE5R6_03540 [Candidatus Heimdallarchaeota archaeon]